MPGLYFAGRIASWPIGWQKNEADLVGRPRAFLSSPNLEHQLRAKLHYARRGIKAQEVAVRTRRRCLHRRNSSERWIWNRCRPGEATEVRRVRQTEVGVIERVERLCANREVEPFGDLEVLEQVQIHVEVVRSAILVAALR